MTDNRTWAEQRDHLVQQLEDSARGMQALGEPDNRETVNRLRRAAAMLRGATIETPISELRTAARGMLDGH